MSPTPTQALSAEERAQRQLLIERSGRECTALKARLEADKRDVEARRHEAKLTSRGFWRTAGTRSRSKPLMPQTPPCRPQTTTTLRACLLACGWQARNLKQLNLLKGDALGVKFGPCSTEQSKPFAFLSCRAPRSVRASLALSNATGLQRVTPSPDHTRARCEQPVGHGWRNGGPEVRPKNNTPSSQAPRTPRGPRSPRSQTPPRRRRRACRCWCWHRTQRQRQRGAAGTTRSDSARQDSAAGTREPLGGEAPS